MVLERDLTPIEAWSHLRGDIIYAGAKAACLSINNWIWVSLILKSRDYQPPPLAIILPTTPLIDGDLLRHLHQILIRPLPGHEPALHFTQRSLIASHIREVEVELRHDQEEK